jgi:outer membrane protein OmpA-like peptidoglycan-associated protein
LTPYLTLSLAGGVGLNSISPDWRFIFGVSTSTGLGSYIRPVPMLPQELKQKQDAAAQAAVKPVKIIPISPKLALSPALTEAVSQIEVPVEPDKEEVVIRTYGQIILPPQRTDTRPFVPPPPQDVSSTVAGDTPPTYGIDVKRETKDTAKATPAKIDEKLIAYRKFRFPDIVGYFQQGQAELTPEARKLLSDVAEQIRTDKSWAYLRIDGYTDGIGSQKYNTDLSLRRAIEVASYLINREGIDPARLYVRGMGSAKELADNQTDAGRKMNRRFEILFLQRDERP